MGAIADDLRGHAEQAEARLEELAEQVAEGEEELLNSSTSLPNPLRDELADALAPDDVSDKCLELTPFGWKFGEAFGEAHHRIEEMIEAAQDEDEAEALSDQLKQWHDWAWKLVYLEYLLHQMRMLERNIETLRQSAETMEAHGF